MTKPDDQTMTYDIGFKRPPVTTQFRKGVSGNPFGKKAERHFVESILSKVLFGVVAPNPERRSHSCTNMEAMATVQGIDNLWVVSQSAGCTETGGAYIEKTAYLGYVMVIFIQ